MRWLVCWNDPETGDELGRLELRHRPGDTGPEPPPPRAVTTHEATIPAGVTLSYRFEREDDLEDLVAPT